MRRHTRYAFRISCGVFLLCLAVCAPRPTAPLFIPPTRLEIEPTAAIEIAFATATPVIIAAPTATATPEPSATPLPPTPKPPCTDALKYVEDITIPDGTIVAAGQSIAKQWRVENNGSCDWDARYHLKLVDGFPLGIFGEQALYPARSGAQAVISLNFTAPLDPGTYRTAWQAINPDGTPFGTAVFMEVVVQ